LSSKSYFIQNTALSSVEIDNELVMITDDQTHFMSLNTTGKLIFDYLTTPKSLDEIIKFVCIQFDADAARVSEDIPLFLEELTAHQVLLPCCI
jgi:hypothetical protein